MDIQPPPLSLEGNLSENWRRWYQKFGFYLMYKSETVKKEVEKVGLLLSMIGDEALDVYGTFKFTDDVGEFSGTFEHHERLKLKDIVKQFEDYCNPRKMILLERFVFWHRSQGEAETIDQYVTELRKIFKNCEYEGLDDILIRDQLVFGIRDHSLRKRLLGEDVVKLTLQKALAFCRASEATEYQAGEMEKPKIHAMTKSNWSNKSGAHHGGAPKSSAHYGGEASGKSKSYSKTSGKSSSKSSSKRQFKCRNCGNTHGLNECPAYGKKCYNCQNMHHYKQFCPNKSVHAVNEAESESCDSSDELFVGAIKTNHEGKAWFVDVEIEGKLVKFKLDTGAEVNVIPLNVYSSFQDVPVTETQVKLSSYSDHQIDVVGKVSLSCKVVGEKSQELEFFVANVESPPVLGIVACQKLNLVKKVHGVEVLTNRKAVKKGMTKDFVQAEYADVFRGLGEMPGEYRIVLNDDVVPVIHASRKILYALNSRLETKLKDMVKQGVIVSVDEPTDWVSSLVVVEKKNGTLRVCLDPRDLNRAIKREHHPTPRPEDVAAKLHGKKVFSIIDQKDGYWQIKLDEKSSKLCTFNTPFGRYRFRRMPFGISSAAEVFQKKNEQLFGDIPNCFCIADDMLIAGDDEEEHDKIVRTVLDRGRQHGVKFNLSKIQWKVPEVCYMGNIISKDGMTADPKKIQAIQEFPQPTTITELQRFLGMVNYLGQFVKDLSTTSAPLRQLLRSDVEFVWNHEQEKAFSELKDALTKTPTLVFYDPKKDLTIQCDASKDGIGACLLQEGQPVAYASRAMISAETRYAQIEKELLAIVFSAEKFKHYIYGRSVLVHSDHKPLESVMKKSLTKASPRLQRMLLRLQKYTLNVVYKKGKDMHIADALSRAYLKAEELDKDLHEEMEVMVHSLVQNLPISADRKEEIREEIREDESLQQLRRMIHSGWPESKKGVPDYLKPYWDVKDTIFEADGLLFVENKVIIPSNMTRVILDLLHESHLGIEKTRSRARDILFWPGMSRDIEARIQNCSKCAEYSRKQQKEKMIPHPIPERPMQKIGVDIFTYGGNDYVCVVDYYSKFPFIRLLKDKTAGTIVAHLKSIMGEQGIPEEVISDNMPFASAEFKKFAVQYKFTSTTSSPTYAQSNGQVERTIGTVKQILRKADDACLALLEYRNTPVKGMNYSPSQMLNSRRLKSKIPVATAALEPEVACDARVQLKQRQENMVQLYNQRAKNLRPLTETETVRVRENSKWKPALVLQKHDAPRSYVVQTEGGSLLRRNRRDLLKVPPGSTAFRPAPPPTKELIVVESEMPTPKKAPPVQRGKSPVRVNRHTEQAPLKGNAPTVIQAPNVVVKQTRFGRTSKPPKKLDL